MSKEKAKLIDLIFVCVDRGGGVVVGGGGGSLERWTESHII